jgi:hypothetical protein
MTSPDSDSGFAMITWDRAKCESVGIVPGEYPVPVAALDGLVSAGGSLDFAQLLAWLQEHVTDCGNWREYHERMHALIRLVAPDDSSERITAHGDNWSLICGPVNLTAEVVTLVRDGELLAAARAEGEHELVVASYAPMDSYTCTALIRSAMPELMVPADEPRLPWRALSYLAHRTSTVYRSAAGKSYVQLWEYGVGVGADRRDDPNWAHLREALPMRPTETLVQLGVCYSLASCFGS